MAEYEKLKESASLKRRAPGDLFYFAFFTVYGQLAINVIMNYMFRGVSSLRYAVFRLLHRYLTPILNQRIFYFIENLISTLLIFANVMPTFQDI